ncbi:MAG: MBL fold metallo-hydrolase [Methanoregula sp.]|jgi:hydroxyacylglutathione hydrolase|uniref:MBL fold metallo-hydrolase n=1 Tax=Methanoregula sp. TaxID=2052170 RepID=UPI003D151C34
MLFERVISEGLAHNSYLVASAGRAAVIDPRRDVDIYAETAARHELAITHIFETHRNEDYVSGSLELQDRCGAEIYHGHQTAFAFGNPVHENDTFTLGSLELEVLETPGHTEESISLVLRDREVSDRPFMVFCGDTLFAGEIGRTDFYGPERKAEMAAKIHDSIRNKILPLGDGVIVCPAHGSGSVCGGEIADHPFTTAGYERVTNPRLALDRETFIRNREAESPYLPPYFRQMEMQNLNGAPLLHRVPDLRPLSITEVNRFRKSGCQILDIRSPTSFGAGHIPGSISVWRDGIPAFMGWFFDYDRPVVIVDDFNLALEKVIPHLVRLGYDTIAGYPAGGFPAWSKAGQEIATVPTCSVGQLRDRLETTTPFLLDVRDIRNRNAVGHIRGARHIYIGELPGRLDEVPRDEPVFVYCDAGFKGSLAASILSLHHYHNVTNVLGGMSGWKQAGFRIEH